MSAYVRHNVVLIVRAVVPFAIGIGFAQIAERAVAHVVTGRTGPLMEMMWKPVEVLPAAPDAGYEARKTRSVLTVYVTRRSRYDSPLPNTRYFNPYLELRQAGRLDRGFRNSVPNPAAFHGYSIDFTVDPSRGEIEIVHPGP